MGFVNKDRAEQLLEEGKFSAGTFMLRFSDKHFTNSDGRKSVYGRLTSCVAVLKESKGNANHVLSKFSLQYSSARPLNRKRSDMQFSGYRFDHCVN
jgi:hypothetical protein